MSTVVSCYYNVRSKFPPEKYVEWMNHFCQLSINLVLFTNKQSRQYISMFENKSNVYIVEQEVNEFVTARWRSFWEYCDEIDSEPKHSADLFQLWTNKVFFVDHAIKLNPFNSQYFVWTDIGVIRSPVGINSSKNYPNKLIKMLKDNETIYMAQVEPQQPHIEFQHNILSILHNKNNNSCGPVSFIAGGFFGGTINSLQLFKMDYEDQIQLFIKEKCYAGKEQNIFNNLYFTKERRVNILLLPCQRFEHDQRDSWFSFLTQLSISDQETSEIQQQIQQQRLQIPSDGKQKILEQLEENNNMIEEKKKTTEQFIENRNILDSRYHINKEHILQKRNELNNKQQEQNNVLDKKLEEQKQLQIQKTTLDSKLEEQNKILLEEEQNSTTKQIESSKKSTKQKQADILNQQMKTKQADILNQQIKTNQQEQDDVIKQINELYANIEEINSSIKQNEIQDNLLESQYKIDKEYWDSSINRLESEIQHLLQKNNGINIQLKNLEISTQQPKPICQKSLKQHNVPSDISVYLIGSTQHQNYKNKTLEVMRRMNNWNIELIEFKIEVRLSKFRSGAEAFIRALTNAKLPALIVEDDIALTGWIPQTLSDIPEDSDCIYVGLSTSAADMVNMTSIDENKWRVVSDKMIKIDNMLGTQSILVCTERFRTHWISQLQRSFDDDVHYDIYNARTLKNWNVYGYRLPWFYQDGSLQGAELATKVRVSDDGNNLIRF
jgi:hypothetical protein